MKRAQAAVIGFVFSIVLILVAFSLFSSQFGMMFNKDSGKYSSLTDQSKLVVNSLSSNGYPQEWTNLSVKKVGLLDGDRISLKKLQEFAKLEYYQSKLLLGIKDEYVFFIERANGSKVVVPGTNRDFLGWNGNSNITGNGGYPFTYFFEKIQTNSANIIKKESIVYLEEGISEKSYAKMVVYLFDRIDDPTGITPHNDLICKTVLGSCSADEVQLIKFDNWGHAYVSGGDYSICCKGESDSFASRITTDTECNSLEIAAAKISGETNGHLQQASYNDYPYLLCIKPKIYGASFNCGYNSGSCLSESTCLFSVTGADNAHIGTCGRYSQQYCCSLILP